MGNLFKMPADQVKEIIVFAFGEHSVKRKLSLRIFKQVILLARQRGYTDVDAFTAHFQSYFKSRQQNNDNFDKFYFDRLSTRYLNDLFEYVSSDEIVRLSQVSTVTV